MVVLRQGRSGFPVFACLVRDQTQLCFVVRLLRRFRQLRKGVNVTSFFVPPFFQVKVVAHVDNIKATVVPVGCRQWSVEFCSAAGHVDDASVALTRADHCLSEMDLRGAGFAVHATGELSADLLEKLFPPVGRSGDGHCYNSDTGVACVLLQLRVYSDLCCAAEDLPHPIYALRAIGERADSSAMQPAAEEQGRQRHISSFSSPSHASYAFTFSELFAGVGMFRVGLERAGGRCVFAVECAEPARCVYLVNHNTAAAPLLGDITAIPSYLFPHHDVLTAGFPCQSFAKAGSATGLRHEKGCLFYEVVRVLHAASPRAFILENVENLARVDNGAQLDTILRVLREPAADCEGPAYIVDCRVIDGALVTPQRRRRIYFIGIRADLPHASARALCDAIDAAVQRLEVYCETHVGAPRCVRDVLEFGDSDISIEEEDRCKAGEHAKGRQNLASLCLTETQWAAVQQSKTFCRSPGWRIVDVSGLARTLMGSYRTSYQLYSEFVPLPPGYASPVRFYSIRECARLQGIPDWFVFTVPFSSSLFSTTIMENCDGEMSKKEKKQVASIPSGAVYKLIGNAVNPIIVEYLGRALLACLLA